MTILWILISVAFALLALLLYAARGRGERVTSPEQLVARTFPVDLEAFQNLMDPVEEEFLRSQLPAPEFRSLQRERMRAAAEYVARVSHNAAVLLRYGGAMRLSPNPEVAVAGKQLSDQAIRLRLLALMALGKVGLGMLLPGTRVSAARLVYGYQQTSGLASRITRMQSMARAA